MFLFPSLNPSLISVCQGDNYMVLDPVCMQYFSPLLLSSIILLEILFLFCLMSHCHCVYYSFYPFSSSYLNVNCRSLALGLLIVFFHSVRSILMAPNAIKRLTCVYSWISRFKFWIYLTTWCLSYLILFRL